MDFDDLFAGLDELLAELDGPGTGDLATVEDGFHASPEVDGFTSTELGSPDEGAIDETFSAWERDYSSSTSGDWYLDLMESLGDLDGDGIENEYDFDVDNDGVDDVVDTDGDGIVDTYDTDTDGDGIEDEADRDTDNDGVDDVGDADEDGIVDTYDTDTDGDGIENHLDMDADGTGVSDLEEQLAEREASLEAMTPEDRETYLANEQAAHNAWMASMDAQIGAMEWQAEQSASINESMDYLSEANADSYRTGGYTPYESGITTEDSNYARDISEFTDEGYGVISDGDQRYKQWGDGVYHKVDAEGNWE